MHYFNQTHSTEVRIENQGQKIMPPPPQSTGKLPGLDPDRSNAVEHCFHSNLRHEFLLDGRMHTSHRCLHSMFSLKKMKFETQCLRSLWVNGSDKYVQFLICLVNGSDKYVQFLICLQLSTCVQVRAVVFLLVQSVATQGLYWYSLYLHRDCIGTVCTYALYWNSLYLHTVLVQSVPTHCIGTVCTYTGTVTGQSAATQGL